MDASKVEVPEELSAALASSTKHVILKALHKRLSRRVRGTQLKQLAVMDGFIHGEALVVFAGWHFTCFEHTMSFAVAQLFCRDKDTLEGASALTH